MHENRSKKRKMHWFWNIFTIAFKHVDEQLCPWKLLIGTTLQLSFIIWKWKIRLLALFRFQRLKYMGNGEVGRLILVSLENQPNQPHLIKQGVNPSNEQRTKLCDQRCNYNTSGWFTHVTYTKMHITITLPCSPMKDMRARINVSKTHSHKFEAEARLQITLSKTP